MQESPRRLNPPPCTESPKTSGEPVPAKTITVGRFSVALDPFECHCCPDFRSPDQEEVLAHLAGLTHHSAHQAFLEEFGPFRPEEAEALNAFDLYVPPKPVSRAAAFLAKLKPAKEITQHTTAAGCILSPQILPDAPRDVEARPALASQAPTQARGVHAPASPDIKCNPSTTASTLTRETKIQDSPSNKDAAPDPSLPQIAQAETPPPTRGMTTRTNSGGLARKNYGDGFARDYELSTKFMERSLEGKDSPPSPSRPKTPPQGRVTLPWFDYICNVTLSDPDSASKHFKDPEHSAAVEAFLAKHRKTLMEKEPEAIQLLLSTLPERRERSLSFAESLAAGDRASNPARPQGSPSTGVATTSMPELAPLTAHQEELGRWLADFGRCRTMPLRESRPEDKVYSVGLEETRLWHGKFESMPTPAWCELCLVTILYANQAKTHCEGTKHREKCTQAGDKMIARVVQARRETTGTPRDHKVTFTASREPPKSSGSRSSGSSKPPTVEMVCAAAGCNGRVTYQVGDQRAVGRCGKCGLRQNPPTPVKYA